MKRIGVGLAAMVWLWASLGAIAWATTYAYIPNYSGNTVTRIKASDLTYRTVPLPGCGPYGAAVAPDGSYVLVTCNDSRDLAVVVDSDFEDEGEPIRHEVLLGESPRGVAIAPTGGLAYVANYDDGTVTRIDTRTLSVRVLDVGNGPWGVAAVYDEAAGDIKVYVANHLDGSVSVITDDGAQTEVDTIADVGINPVGVAVSPDGRYAYVANYTDGQVGTVAVIRTSDDQVMATLPAGIGPWGVAVGSQGEFIYVTNSQIPGPFTVTVIRATDQGPFADRVHSVYHTFPVGQEPLGVAAPRNGSFAYAINGDDTISRIDIETQIVTAISEIGIDGAYALGAFIGGRPPARPSGLTAQTISSSSIELSWVDNSTDSLGFKIERRKTGDEAYIEIVQVPAGTTSFRDAGLQRDTTYQYRIRAFNEAADSGHAVLREEATTDSSGFSWCFIDTLIR